MALITHRAPKAANHPVGREIHAPIVSLPAFVYFMRRAMLRGAKLIAAAAQAIAEARRQRAMLEAELYLNRYSHASKNDDDLPVVRPSVTSKRWPQR